MTLATDQSAVTVPSTLTIAGGQSFATFQLTTTAVASNTQVLISATFGTSIKTLQGTVIPPSLTSLVFTIASVTSGGSATATVGMNGPAGSGGVAVLLTSNDPAFGSIPANVTVPAGQQNVPVQINIAPGAPTGTLTVTATTGGSSRVASVTVQSLAVATLTLNPTSVRGGGTAGTVNATVTLPSPAVIQFALPISGSNVAGVVPSSLNFNLGQATAIFTISTTAVTLNTVGTITAGAGPGAKTASLTVTP